MRRLVQHRFFYPIILILVCLVICFLNYTPNTFLTGWDTLHPEFNFGLNISRLVNGVWRADQGLGAVADANAVPPAAKTGERMLKRRNLLTQNVLAIINRLFNSHGNLLPKFR